MKKIERLILLFVFASFIVAYFNGIFVELMSALLISAIAVSLIVIVFLFWAHLIEKNFFREEDS